MSKVAINIALYPNGKAEWFGLNRGVPKPTDDRWQQESGVILIDARVEVEDGKVTGLYEGRELIPFDPAHKSKANSVDSQEPGESKTEAVKTTAATTAPAKGAEHKATGSATTAAAKK